MNTNTARFELPSVMGGRGCSTIEVPQLQKRGPGHEIKYTYHAGERERGSFERHVGTHNEQRGVGTLKLLSSEAARVTDASSDRAGNASQGEGACGTHAEGVTAQSQISTSDSRNLMDAGPRPQVQVELLISTRHFLAFSQFGPVRLPVFTKLLTGNFLFRKLLYANSYFCRTWATSISNVLKMAPCGAALRCKPFALFSVQSSKVGFQVHSCITSNAVLYVNSI